MNKRIIKKIEEKLGTAGLFDLLVRKISFSDLQSLLLEVMDEKSGNLQIKDIFRQYETDPFVKPSSIAPSDFLRMDDLLFSCLPENVKTMELSPVSPLGCCSRLGIVSQKRIISTIRRTEVCSDPTNILALEAAKRRKAEDSPVSLAVSQRLLRAEKTLSAHSFPHFKVFSLCFADKDKGNLQFEADAIKTIIIFYNRALSELFRRGNPISEAKFILKFQEENILKHLQKNLSDMEEKTRNIKLSYSIDKKENWNYYKTVRFNLFLKIKEEDYFIADGGDTDWTAKLLNNMKERFFISGLGSERLISILNKEV